MPITPAYDELAATSLRLHHFGHLGSITRWDQDPFTYGSGSVTPAGSSGSLRDVFSKPIANALFWAGEHTSRQYPGSMHGAWLSGIRAADQVLASD